MKLKLLAVGMMLALGACAGRDAAPVSVVQEFDKELSCPQIIAEIEQNNAKLDQLEEEKSGRRNQNIAVGVVGAVLFWPALFALDLSDAVEAEIKAINDRNLHLANMHQDCDLPGRQNKDDETEDEVASNA